MVEENSTLKPTAEDILTGESVVITNEDASLIDIVPKGGDTPADHTIKLLKRIVPPHEKISREVTDADVPKVIEEAYVLRDLCIIRNGLYGSAYAMAHPQIDDTDPMRFFVFQDGRVIINPRITLATKFQVDSDEGCMTFPTEPMKVVGRSHKVTVEYRTLLRDGEKQVLSPQVEGHFSGRESKIFQHEIDHMDGKYIYTKEDTEKPKEEGVLIHDKERFAVEPLEEPVKEGNNGSDTPVS